MRSSTTPTCGRFLGEARKRHGLTQAELAERVGMTQANISRIERGKVSPSLRTLDRLLGAIGETLTIGATPLADPTPGGGNTVIRELRADYEEMTEGERVERAALLSNLAGELAASRGST